MSKNDFSHLTDSQLKEMLSLEGRMFMIDAAKKNMVDFCKIMMPDTCDPDDALKTEYDPTGHAKMLCEIVERFESGKSKRVAVSIPPQHGKTLNLSQLGLAWIWGKNPRKNILVVTYNQTRADELGHEFRQLVRDRPTFRQVFPEVEFQADAKSKSFMQNKAGGKIFFIGVGGTITGRTADYIIIDDPFKGDDDEFTPAYLEKMWSWFFKVAYSRASNKTKICIVHTRWFEDDLIGRLCDPTHPERKKRFKGISQDWEFMNIPGVIYDERLANALGLKLEVPTNPRVIEQFGEKPCTALWPKEKSLEFFAQWKRGDARSFSALVMGSPTPDDGAYFTADMIVEYHAPSELPTNMRKYGASDHAVSEKKKRDKTVLGCVGIDTEDDIWVLPDLVWDQMETDKTVENLLQKFKQHKPHCWWMESELISKSFGPFLRKRMIEDKVYTLIDPVRPANDKMTRARSIQGRMSMRKVHFPAFAPWYQDAKNQILRFPYGTHDDFCLTGEMLVTMEDDKYKRICDIKVGDRVLTPDGSKRVVASGQTNVVNDLTVIRFTDGTQLHGTGNHPVCLEDGTFVPLDMLQCCDRVLKQQRVSIWRKTKLLNIKDTVTGVILSQNTHIIRIISMLRNRAGGFCTDMCGKITTGKYQKDMTFITLIRIHLITILQILNVLLCQNIGRCICLCDQKQKNILHIWQGLDQKQVSGISLKRVENGIQQWSNLLGISVNYIQKSVNGVVKSMKHHFLLAQSFVVQTVALDNITKTTRNRVDGKKSGLIRFVRSAAHPLLRFFKEQDIVPENVKIVSCIEKIKTNTPTAVYNLTVEDNHVYYAQGVLNHNCDWIAYIGLGLDKELAATSYRSPKSSIPKTGTGAWVIWASEQKKRSERATSKGW